jgi:hypothetical protein
MKNEIISTGKSDMEEKIICAVCSKVFDDNVPNPFEKFIAEGWEIKELKPEAKIDDIRFCALCGQCAVTSDERNIHLA